MLLTNAHVVTMDDAGTEYEGGWILLEDGLVKDLGAGAKPEAAERARPRRCRRHSGARQHAPPPLPEPHARARAGRRTSSTGSRRSTRSGPRSTTRPSTRRRASGSPSSRSRAARRSSTTTTSSRAATTGLLEAEIRAARELGVRIVASRGSMDLGESQGGLPPDSLVETRDDALADTERLPALAGRRARPDRRRALLAVLGHAAS